MKVVKVDLKNIVTSHYQIRSNKYSFNMWEVEMTRSKNNWMTRNVTYKLKSEKSAKKNFIYENLRTTNFQCNLLYSNSEGISENVLSLFFRYLYENGTEEASYRDKCLFKRILNTAGIYYYLILEWVHSKESSVMMFLVLSAVEEL